VDTTLTDEDAGRMSVSRLIEILGDFPKDAKVEVDVLSEGIAIDIGHATFDKASNTVYLEQDY